MNDRIREIFESEVVHSFSITPVTKETGEYFSPILEDHWQTFQEGFEFALKECIDIVQWTPCELDIPQRIVEEIKTKFGLK